MTRSAAVGGLALGIAACGLDAVGVAPLDEATVQPDGAAPAEPDNSVPDGGAEPDATGDGETDAASLDGGDGGGGVIAAVGATGLSGSTVTLAPTKTGDFLAVLVAQNKDSSSSAVTAITDDAPGGSDVFVSANQRAINSSCGISSEIWFARNIRAGATHVTVSVSSSTWFDVWVVELSGLSATGAAETGGVASSQPSASVLKAPEVTLSASPAAIFSVAQSCSSSSGVSGLQSGTGFTALSALEGNGAAYRITTGAGTYGAIFVSGDHAWNASTAVFR